MGARIFFDGLVNALTGAGTSRDSRSYNRYHHRQLSDVEIMSAYRAGWMMRKIIDKPASEMVREWRDWQAEAADIEKLEALEKKLGLRAKIRQAEVLRGLGGAGMVMWLGSETPSLPVNPRSIALNALRGIVVWHRSRFTLGPMITDPASDWHGHPEYYELSDRSGGRTRLHPSRVVAFRGDTVPDIASATWEESWWGDSKVQTVLDAVQNSDTAENSFAGLIKDARNRRVYIPGLFGMVTTAKGEADFAKRMEAFAAGESMYGATLLDAGNEEGKGGEKLEDRQMVWAGIPEIKASFLASVAAASDMPATVLLGKSPDGMNATGNGDLAVWEKTIKARQDLDLRPCLDQIDGVLIPSAGVKVTAADGAKKTWFQFAPLSTPTEAEEATTFKTFMEAVSIVQTTGVLPDVVLTKGMQTTLVERGWINGIEKPLSELGEDERFGLNETPEEGEEDPNAIQIPNGGKEVDPNLPAGRATTSASRRAANDKVTDTDGA